MTADRIRTLTIEAFVIRHRDWGESDRIITTYSKELGKARLVIKGARKIQSRKAGHLEPFSRVRMQLSRTSDLPIVTQVETITSFQPLKENLDLIVKASYLAELVEKFTQEDQEGEPPLFRLISDTLDRLMDPQRSWNALRFFENRILDISGYRPEFFNCVECHKEIIQEDQFFAPSSGGVVCANCGISKPGMWKMPAKTLKYLRFFQKNSFNDYARTRLSEEERILIETFYQNYIKYLLEKNLNTSDFMRAIEGNR
ncbi:MAG TPA: DNA repair protein RecO [Anaerolineales bacterium]|nr:DNA repair protein RecO [Anaerolineales bacterium]